METKIAAAYIRVSDERQDEYSPDSQLKLSRDFAKKQGFYIPDEFVFYDDGISGKSTKKRTAFNNMIAAAKDKSNNIEAIFVWKFSRFARNQEESIVYKSLLRKNGVDVISVSEPIIDGPFGSLIERIIEWMDEYYLIRLSGEVKRGMLEKASRGEAPCAPPLGYDLHDSLYIPNDKAPLIRDIFTRFIAGDGMRRIADDLNLKGYKTKRGNKFDNRQIEYILNNPVYAGKIRWSTEGRAASHRDYNNGNIITVDGKHEPIITPEQFATANERISATKKMYSKHQRPDDIADFMLKGLVRCSACGATLIRSTKNRLQCHQYSKGLCHVSHSVSIETANATVEEALRTALRTSAFNISPTNKVASSDAKSAVDYSTLIKSEEKRLARAKEAYQNGVDTLDEYRKAKSEITSRIAGLKKAVDETSNQKPAFDTKKIQAKVISVIDFINSDATEAAKNVALRTIITHITFDRQASRFDLHFHL